MKRVTASELQRLLEVMKTGQVVKYMTTDFQDGYRTAIETIEGWFWGKGKTAS